MDTEILMEIDDIQTELDGSIGLIVVIADGLSVYSRNCALSGESTQRYVNALYGTFDALYGIAERLRERLDCAKARVS